MDSTLVAYRRGINARVHYIGKIIQNNYCQFHDEDSDEMMQNAVYKINII